jgi:shikimate dehydrogenase
MKKYGLIGYPLSHSFSKKYFTDKFEKLHITDAQYELYPIAHISDLQDMLNSQPNMCGLNVTVPHKINVMKYLDWVEDNAKAVGAINCVRIISEGSVPASFHGEGRIRNHDFRLEGYNTDIYGFENSLKPLLTDEMNSALVLGDGGAAKAVKCVLKNLGISMTIVTRTAHENNILFKDLEPRHIKNNLLIINTTPLGTAPNIEEYPGIPYDAITKQHLLFDLVYNPEKTLFLKKGEEKGARIKNGYEMLVLQAEKSWEIWNSEAISL